MLFRSHAVNFATLVFDDLLKTKYPVIYDLLSAQYNSVSGLLKLCLFNFQGYIADVDQELFSKVEKTADDKRIAELQCSTCYNDTHLIISLESFCGFNSNLIKDILHKHYITGVTISVNNKIEEMVHA